jgi:catalase
LSPHQAESPNFYADELKERLAKGPLVFDYVAIMGKTGDQTSDPTLRWDDEDNRPTTPLGKISIAAVAPQETAMPACSFLEMSPTELPAPLTIPSLPCGRLPISCPSRDGSSDAAQKRTCCGICIDVR